MQCDWCHQRVKDGTLQQHKDGECSANLPLPGFKHENCGGTVVPYDSNVWRCLTCWQVVTPEAGQ